MLNVDEESKPFEPGDRVVLRGSGECGIVVHAWLSPELGGIQDCYVVFFGAEFPAPGAAPTKVPYVLRYGAPSLKRARSKDQ